MATQKVEEEEARVEEEKKEEEQEEKQRGGRHILRRWREKQINYTLYEDQKKACLDLIRRYQNKREEAGKGRATASSSAASSAYPTSGKGAKAGKRKRTWEEMQGGNGKGMKKGWSQDQGQASRRGTW